jgi:hypothetical protein
MSFDRLAQALTKPGQPEASLQAIQDACQELIGHRLFTILVLDHARGLNMRYYSSHPAEYPVGGYKPIDATRSFYKIVVEQGEPRFLKDREEIIRTFPDHAAILGLGCESGVNMPVRWNGVTLGSLNLLHEAGYYGPQHRPVLNVLAGLSIMPFLRIIEGAGA